MDLGRSARLPKIKAVGNEGRFISAYLLAFEGEPVIFKVKLLLSESVDLRVSKFSRRRLWLDDGGGGLTTIQALFVPSIFNKK